MNDKLKTIAGVGAKSFLHWLSIVVPGFFSTLIFFFIILFKNTGLAGGGHGNPIAFVIGLFTSNFFGFLIIFGAPIFMILYVVLANKSVIHNAVYMVWKNKAGDFFVSKIQKLLSFGSSNSAASSLSNSTKVRAHLLQESMNDPNSSRIQKMILKFGFNRMKLDDVDFSNPDLKLSDIVCTKFNEVATDLAKPSKKLFLLLLGIQTVLFVLGYTKSI